MTRIGHNMPVTCACTAQPHQAPTSRPRCRVLLADDHQGVRERARRLLENDFDIVAELEDGRSLLKAVGDLNPDVLVLDISIPDLGGIEAAWRLRAVGCRARIVFLTVHDDADIAHLALAAGAMGYVVKPRMVSDLIQAIHHTLTGHRFVSPTSELRRFA